jgi:hypothetical protein
MSERSGGGIKCPQTPELRFVDTLRDVKPCTERYQRQIWMCCKELLPDKNADLVPPLTREMRGSSFVGSVSVSVSVILKVEKQLLRKEKPAEGPNTSTERM